jgi:hypothetical protein
MHPIERLRWVARSPEGDASLVAAEAADALAGFADDPAGLVIASRRLIERRPAAAPLWWLASRVLCSFEPAFEAMDAAADLERDRTPVALAGDLPGGTIAIVGWPDQAGAALRMRGRMDGGEAGAARGMGGVPPTRAPGGRGVSPRQGRREPPTSEAAADRVVVVPSGPPGRTGVSQPAWREQGDDAWRCVDWLQSHGVDARLLRAGEVAAAGRRCVLALLEATAVGPDTFLAAAGSAALAAAAREAHRPVWLVAGVGRALPGPLYDALLRRVGDDPAFEIVPLDAVDEVAGPAGPVPRSGLPRPSCPVAAELLRFSG